MGVVLLVRTAWRGFLAAAASGRPGGVERAFGS
jgi:hypothetical protein